MKPTVINPTTEQVDLAVRSVARQRSVKTRAETLAKFAMTPFLKKALKYSYDPFIRFGVVITPALHSKLVGLCNPMNERPLDFDDPEIWNLLDMLRTSTASSAAKQNALERLFVNLDLSAAYLVLGILRKSLIDGVAVSTVNKAFPGLIEVFGVQLAAKYSDRKVKSLPVYVEPKYDGMRAAALVHPTGEVEIVTRTGRPINAAKYFSGDLLRLAAVYKQEIEATGDVYTGVLFDGELLGSSFNDTVSIFRSDTYATEGTFNLFDAVPLSAITTPGFVSDTYEGRRGLLQRAIAKLDPNLVTPGLEIKMSPAYKVGSKAEIWRMYEGARAMGYEGIIVKDPAGRWERKRSNAWLKVKAEETLDLTITGAFEGEGELEGTLGGIIVDYKGVPVRVGSGFKRDERDILWGIFLDDMVRSESGSSDFELLGSTAEVQFQEVTPAGSLRHPVFVRLRKDKDEASF